MKTVIVSVPDSKEKLIASFLKKNRLKAKILSEEDMEDEYLAKWIEEGMKSEDVPLEKILAHLRKHGVKA